MYFDNVSGLMQTVHASDMLSLILRGTLGTFFLISGFHKAFNKIRRASIKQTFIDDHCYNPAMMYVIPGAELFGGLALLIGFLTPLASAGLIIICLGACMLDGRKRIHEWKPLDAADKVDDALYLPEVLYVVMLVALVIAGPGSYSIDALIRI